MVLTQMITLHWKIKDSLTSYLIKNGHKRNERQMNAKWTPAPRNMITKTLLALFSITSPPQVCLPSPSLSNIISLWHWWWDRIKRWVFLPQTIHPGRQTCRTTPTMECNSACEELIPIPAWCGKTCRIWVPTCIPNTSIPFLTAPMSKPWTSPKDLTGNVDNGCNCGIEIIDVYLAITWSSIYISRSRGGWGRKMAAD